MCRPCNLQSKLPGCDRSGVPATNPKPGGAGAAPGPPAAFTSLVPSLDQAKASSLDPAQQQRLEEHRARAAEREREKQQLEAAIEGKHSKLTEVYKVLESECQVELAACRGGNTTGAPAQIKRLEGGRLR